MKSVYARFTKTDDEGCQFSWVEMFECYTLYLHEVFRLESAHGADAIGHEEISMADYLRNGSKIIYNQY